MTILPEAFDHHCLNVLKKSYNSITNISKYEILSLNTDHECSYLFKISFDENKIDLKTHTINMKEFISFQKLSYESSLSTQTTSWYYRGTLIVFSGNDIYS